MTDETKQVLEVVKEMFEALNAKIDGLGTEMKTRMAKIETTLENDTNKRIQLLAEGYQSVGAIPEKMEQLSEMFACRQEHIHLPLGRTVRIDFPGLFDQVVGGVALGGNHHDDLVARAVILCDDAGHVEDPLGVGH